MPADIITPASARDRCAGSISASSSPRPELEAPMTTTQEEGTIGRVQPGADPDRSMHPTGTSPCMCDDTVSRGSLCNLACAISSRSVGCGGYRLWVSRLFLASAAALRAATSAGAVSLASMIRNLGKLASHPREEQGEAGEPATRRATTAAQHISSRSHPPTYYTQYTTCVPHVCMRSTPLK